MNSCANCLRADPNVSMLTNNAIYCTRWDKPVWKHDTTPRACFEGGVVDHLYFLQLWINDQADWFECKGEVQ